MVNVGHFAIGTDMPKDVAKHDAVVVLRLPGLSWQMLALVALGQLRQRRRLTSRAPIASRVLTAVYPLPDLLRLGARSRDRPVRPGADPIATLGAMEPVGQEKSPGTGRVRPGRGVHPDGKTGDFGIPDERRATSRWFEGLDEGLGQPLGHGLSVDPDSGPGGLR